MTIILNWLSRKNASSLIFDGTEQQWPSIEQTIAHILTRGLKSKQKGVSPWPLSLTSENTLYCTMLKMRLASVHWRRACWLVHVVDCSRPPEYVVNSCSSSLSPGSKSTTATTSVLQRVHTSHPAETFWTKSNALIYLFIINCSSPYIHKWI